MADPYSPADHGCIGINFAGDGHPSHCLVEPVWVGLALWVAPAPTLVRAWACEQHVERLQVARLLGDGDRAELTLRRDRVRAVHEDGAEYRAPEPLARGEAAARLLERARQWAAEHDGYRSASG